MIGLQTQSGRGPFMGLGFFDRLRGQISAKGDLIPSQPNRLLTALMGLWLCTLRNSASRSRRLFGGVQLLGLKPPASERFPATGGYASA